MEQESSPVVPLRPADPEERPRERLTVHGAEHLAAEELVAIVLGTGARGRPARAVARDLLHRAGGVVPLSRASPGELCATPGIGAARAARLAAAFGLGRRAVRASGPRDPPIRGPDDVFRRLRPRLVGLAQEVFLVLALDARGGVTEEVEVARGCLTGVDVHPREVFRPLIRAAAASAVAAHNHPSGDPTPSADDLELTRRLRAVGEVVGIPVLDHVVVGDDRFASIAEVLG